jgi:hypothetical protein
MKSLPGGSRSEPRHRKNRLTKPSADDIQEIV